MTPLGEPLKGENDPADQSKIAQIDCSKVAQIDHQKFNKEPEPSHPAQAIDQSCPTLPQDRATFADRAAHMQLLQNLFCLYKYVQYIHSCTQQHTVMDTASFPSFSVSYADFMGEGGVHNLRVTGPLEGVPDQGGALDKVGPAGLNNYAEATIKTKPSACSQNATIGEGVENTQTRGQGGQTGWSPKGSMFDPTPKILGKNIYTPDPAGPEPSGKCFANTKNSSTCRTLSK